MIKVLYHIHRMWLTRRETNQIRSIGMDRWSQHWFWLIKLPTSSINCHTGSLLLQPTHINYDVPRGASTIVVCWCLMRDARCSSWPSAACVVVLGWRRSNVSSNGTRSQDVAMHSKPWCMRFLRKPSLRSPSFIVMTMTGDAESKSDYLFITNPSN